MSKMEIISAEMHKIANVDVDVKHYQPGDVAACISVAYEIYRDGIEFVAISVIPDENIKYINLPREFSFKFEKEVLSISTGGLEEVVEEIINKLRVLDLIEVPFEYSDL